MGKKKKFFSKMFSKFKFAKTEKHKTPEGYVTLKRVSRTFMGLPKLSIYTYSDSFDDVDKYLIKFDNIYVDFVTVLFTLSDAFLYANPGYTEMLNRYFDEANDEDEEAFQMLGVFVSSIEKEVYEFIAAMSVYDKEMFPSPLLLLYSIIFQDNFNKLKS